MRCNQQLRDLRYFHSYIKILLSSRNYYTKVWVMWLAIPYLSNWLECVIKSMCDVMNVYLCGCLQFAYLSRLYRRFWSQEVELFINCNGGGFKDHYSRARRYARVGVTLKECCRCLPPFSQPQTVDSRINHHSHARYFLTAGNSPLLRWSVLYPKFIREDRQSALA